MRTISRLAVFLFSILMLSNAFAAPPAASLEDRYIAARDAAIEKSSKLYDAGKFDDGAQKAEDATRGELQAQMSAIVGDSARKGFAPPKLNLDTFYKGDEGFGMLDGLRFDAETGKGARRRERATATNMSSPGRTSSSRRSGCSRVGCAATRTGGTRASRMCRSRSMRR
jgi:hypothetical protein